MKAILLLLGFLSSAAMAGNGSGNVSAVFNGGGTSSDSAIAASNGPSFVLPLADYDSTKIVVLVCGINSVATANYLGCYSASGPTSLVHYQVPPGKQLYALSIRVRSGTACASCMITLGAATADFTENGAGVPGGAIPYGASDAVGGFLFVSPTAGQAIDHPFPIYFKSGAWPYVRGAVMTPGATLSVIITGYLK